MIRRMAAIVSAMGLFRGKDEADLPTDHIPRHRSWRFGNIAPFAGRLVIERLRCQRGETAPNSFRASGAWKRSADRPESDATSYVRILANDALLDLRALCGTRGRSSARSASDAKASEQTYDEQLSIGPGGGLVGDGRWGMCTLEAFVESQRYAREEGQVEFRDKCDWRAAKGEQTEAFRLEHDAAYAG